MAGRFVEILALFEQEAEAVIIRIFWRGGGTTWIALRFLVGHVRLLRCSFKSNP